MATLRVEDVPLIAEGRAIARRLCEFRRRYDLSQADVAQLLGVGTSAISRWEQGEREPRRDLAIRLARLSYQLEDG